MTLENDILMKQIDLLNEERLRRSRQQFECVRMNLISVGVVSVSGIYSVVGASTDTLDAVSNNASIIFAMMVVLTTISATLFLFWVDDAITIAGIDRFLRTKEKSVDTHGDLYWYEYRAQLNLTRYFQVKKWIFNFAIFFAFLCPPLLCGIFITMLELIHIPLWLLLVGGAFCVVFLITPLWIWRNFTKRLYG